MVMVRSPIFAATSPGACDEGCCAGADEQARNVAATAKSRALVMNRIIRLLLGNFLAGAHLELAEPRIGGDAAGLRARAAVSVALFHSRRDPQLQRLVQTVGHFDVRFDVAVSGVELRAVHGAGGLVHPETSAH